MLTHTHTHKNKQQNEVIYYIISKQTEHDENFTNNNKKKHKNKTNKQKNDTKNKKINVKNLYRFILLLKNVSGSTYIPEKSGRKRGNLFIYRTITELSLHLLIEKPHLI